MLAKTQTSPCLFCRSPCCTDCSNAFQNQQVLHDEDRDEFLEQLYRESCDITWEKRETDREEVLAMPFRGFPVGKLLRKEFEAIIDVMHSKGFGWVYEHISPYSQKAVKDTSLPYYGLVITRMRINGFGTDIWHDKYVIQLPLGVNPNDTEAVARHVASIVDDWLCTEDGREAWEDTLHDFNWGDISNYIPDSYFQSRGIYNKTYLKEFPISGLITIIVEQDRVFNAPDNNTPMF